MCNAVLFSCNVICGILAHVSNNRVELKFKPPPLQQKRWEFCSSLFSFSSFYLFWHVLVWGSPPSIGSPHYRRCNSFFFGWIIPLFFGKNKRDYLRCNISTWKRKINYHYHFRNSNNNSKWFTGPNWSAFNCYTFLHVHPLI